MGGFISSRIKKKNDVVDWYVIRNTNYSNIAGNLAGLFSGGVGNFFDALTKYNISFHNTSLKTDLDITNSVGMETILCSKFYSAR